MKDEKRILIIPSWYPPDGGYFFKEHSESLARMGWQTDVLVTRLVGVRKLIQAGWNSLRRYRVEEEDGLRVVRSSYLKVPGNEKYNILAWARQCHRIYRRYEKQFGKPDLILAHSATWAGYAAYIIRKRHGIPYVVVEHRSFFVWTTEEARQKVESYHVPLFELAYNNCEKLILVSDSMRKGIEELVPASMDRCMVIPNMIRKDLFLLPEKARKQDPFVFLWAGRLEHVKGVDLLLDAVKIVAEKTDRHFFVRLAGKGSLKQELEMQARALGVSDRVVFLGRLSRNEMLMEMQQANCFVLPSRYEAFGVVLIEAMATGLPLITTRSGGPDSIVTRENGLLIEPDSAEELAASMQKMMVNIDAYTAEMIRSHCLDYYGDISVMKQYDQLFLHLMKE